MKQTAKGEGFLKVKRINTLEDLEMTDLVFLDQTDREELAGYLREGPLWTTGTQSWMEEEPLEVEGDPKEIRVVSVVHSRVFVETHTAIENDEGVWVDDIAFC